VFLEMFAGNWRLIAVYVDIVGQMRIQLYWIPYQILLWRYFMAIASSVLQAVNNSDGQRFWTFDSSELSDFSDAVDGQGGIAGDPKNGWRYHLTAKTPEKMESLGFENMGHTSISNPPWS
jgi:hypothetical protein